MRTPYSVLNHQQPYIGKDLYVNNFAEVENVHELSVLQKNIQAQCKFIQN